MMIMFRFVLVVVGGEDNDDGLRYAGSVVVGTMMIAVEKSSRK